jgi:GT2 family glycosyltransferase
MHGDLCVIIPTYGHLDYAAAALESLFRSTSRAWAILVDDASPDWELGYSSWVAPILERFADRLVIARYSANGGLTRSWNRGLQEARRRNATYACCTNSDVLFPAGWEAPLLAALDSTKLSLLGPVTNAPGPKPFRHQDVTRYFHGYRLTDDIDYLDEVARSLRGEHDRTVLPGAVNGFCMMARTDRWWGGAYSRHHVFDPRYPLTGNERELQRRWRDKGWRFGVAPGSFVFHYRAVTRGGRHKYGMWLRRKRGP